MVTDLTPSSRPCDVEYRINAACKALKRSIDWLHAIDGKAFADAPNGTESCNLLISQLQEIYGAMQETAAHIPQKSKTRPKASCTE